MTMDTVACERLLAFCRAALCEQQCMPLSLQNDEELAALYACAAHHDVAHIVSDGLYRAGLLDTKTQTGEQFQRAQMLAVFRYEHQRAEAARIFALLEEAGIEHLALKGSVLRSLYAHPWMRTSSDIDVLVHREDVERASELLIERLDYRRDEDWLYNFSLYSPTGVHLELHFELAEDGCSAVGSALLSDVWSYTLPVEDQRYGRKLSDDMFYYYHVEHMAKHFGVGGCGIRTFMDLWLLEHRVEHDRAARDELLRKGGLLTFADAARGVCEAWFSGEPMSELGAAMAKYVLQGGVFGTVENAIAVEKSSEGHGELRHVMQRIFMPYESLVAAYPSLKGRRYLTFFYQIRRLISRVLGGRLGRGLNEVKRRASIDQERVATVKDLFDRLGI